jgi:hypothetical protein
MTERKPVAEQPLIRNTPVTPWADARKRLNTHEQDRTYWLATVRHDGRPHIAPILGLWLDGAFYFITGETSRKGKNLANDPRCAIAVSSVALPSLDIFIEGDARKVTAEAELQTVVDAYGSRMGWPIEVSDGGVVGPNAPTAGPPPYAVYELTPITVFGLPGVAGMGGMVGAADAFSPTRWRF